LTVRSNLHSAISQLRSPEIPGDPRRFIFVVVARIEHVLEGVIIVESPGKEEIVFKKVIKIFSDYEKKLKQRNYAS
jgi:hypothetical protein